MGLPPVVPQVPAAVIEPVVPQTKLGKFLLIVKDNAEWYSVLLFFLVLIIWLHFMPLPKPPYAQAELLKGIADAKDIVTKQELGRDLLVWNRYEILLRHFEWGSDFNWYLYSSLRVIVIVLGAITPALIVAPALANKKFLAALPAAIVAIGAGFATEFDFRTEAANHNAALVRLEAEKMSYITQRSPTYAIAAVSTSTSVKQGETQLEVPYIPSQSPQEARANFAFRIESIYKDEADERDKFLRGTKDQERITTRPAPVVTKTGTSSH